MDDVQDFLCNESRPVNKNMKGEEYFTVVEKEVSTMARKARELLSYVELAHGEFDYDVYSFLSDNVYSLLKNIEGVFLRLDDYRTEK